MSSGMMFLLSLEEESIMTSRSGHQCNHGLHSARILVEDKTGSVVREKTMEVAPRVWLGASH